MKRFVPLCLCAFVSLLLPYMAYAETSIAAGASHTILVKDGTVWTWGRNDYGQLGNGANTDSYIPSQIDISNVVSVKCGNSHSIALKSDKTVWCWGKNNTGQLGDGTTTGRETPVSISSLTDIVSIAAGHSHSIAVRGTEKAVLTWGSSVLNQLGYSGENTCSMTPCQRAPLQLFNFADISSVSAGYGHNLAIRNGEIRAWGYNLRGQIGDGTTSDKLAPVSVKADASSNFDHTKAIAAGYSHSVALKDDGTVWAWGDNSKGQLGDNTNIQRLYPVQVSGLDSVSAIASGEYHVLAIRNGAVWAWGDNFKGQLGDGTTVQRKVPTQIPNFSNVIAIAAGGNHSLAVKEDGTLWAWGDNTYGQLGCKTSIAYSSVPIQVLAPGDLNADWKIDLNDVILSLRISSNIPTIAYLSDVNGDGKIGQEESIYDLQIVAENR